MTVLAYFDCPSGISGDMCLGALVDAGVPLEYLDHHLAQLGLRAEYALKAERVLRQGQAATRVAVQIMNPEHPSTASSAASEPSSHFHHQKPDHGVGGVPQASPAGVHPHHAQSGSSEAVGLSTAASEVRSSPDHPHPAHSRHLKDIEGLIQGAALPEPAKTWSMAVFRQLARAEGAVHGISPEEVHFHEVGATDAIVDIVGTCLGLAWLGVDTLVCSALPTGGGSVRAAHGWLPVPAPAVLRLMEMAQVPLYSNGVQRELVTPTGCAIATTLAQSFGPPPAMTLKRVGLGAGGRNLPIPNILRLWLGDPTAPGPHPASTTKEADAPLLTSGAAEEASVSLSSPSLSTTVQGQLETITVLETQVDDLNPQVIGYLYDRLLAVGALDVFTQPVGMKKSRPGTLITVICPPHHLENCEAILFAETTTLGIRRRVQQRVALQRDFVPISTPYGVVQLKRAYRDDPTAPINVQPEYEDCARLAREHNVPWQDVHRTTLAHWYSQQTPL